MIQVSGSDRYLQIYPSGDVYSFPKLTKKHLEDCQNGYYNITDLELERECVSGEWVENKTP